jgi:hypothetical protein
MKVCCGVQVRRLTVRGLAVAMVGLGGLAYSETAGGGPHDVRSHHGLGWFSFRSPYINAATSTGYDPQQHSIRENAHTGLSPANVLATSIDQVDMARQSVEKISNRTMAGSFQVDERGLMSECTIAYTPTPGVVRSDDLSLAMNWSPRRVPNGNDVACVDGELVANVGVSVDLTVGQLVVTRITSLTVGASATLSITGAPTTTWTQFSFSEIDPGALPPLTIDGVLSTGTSLVLPRDVLLRGTLARTGSGSFLVPADGVLRLRGNPFLRAPLTNDGTIEIGTVPHRFEAVSLTMFGDTSTVLTNNGVIIGSGSIRKNFVNSDEDPGPSLINSATGNITPSSSSSSSAAFLGIGVPTTNEGYYLGFSRYDYVAIHRSRWPMDRGRNYRS